MHNSPGNVTLMNTPVTSKETHYVAGTRKREKGKEKGNCPYVIPVVPKQAARPLWLNGLNRECL